MTDLLEFLPAPEVKRAISFLNPWPYTILHMGKRVENRDKPIVSAKNLNRTLWMHVSQSMSKADERFCLNFVQKIGLDPTEIPKRQDLTFGGIVARFKIVDVILPGGRTRLGSQHPKATDPWYMGQWGYVLDEVEEVPFVPCRGALSCWVIPPEVAVQL